MSRHRNIRSYQYSDDYDDENDFYGRSVEEDTTISPTDASFIYDRSRAQSNMSDFFVDIDNSHSNEIGGKSMQQNEEMDGSMNKENNVVDSTVLPKEIKVVHSCNNIVTQGFALLDESENTAKKKELSLPKDELRQPEKSKVEIKRKSPEHEYQIVAFKNKSYEDISVIAEQFKKDRGNNDNLYLIVIGHVDAGKSTLMGHLLHKLGYVSQKLMHKYERETQKIGKQSFLYAWILDEIGEERTRGITIDIARNKFKTNTKMVTLLDAPGHKDFIPNMVTGVTQADVALLVVDATKGEFETGFDSGGQTREHALIVRSLGVSQIGVAVNKMDNVDWSQERFNEICKKLSSFLHQVGFKPTDITFVPCSGLTGENLIGESNQFNLNSWYNGPTLIQLIDSFKTPLRPISKPFRMCVNDIYKGVGTVSCIAGRVECGYINVGKKVLIQPQGEIANIKAIAIDDVNTNTVYAGDYVNTVLTNYDPENLSVGSVLCDVEKPIPITSKFEAKIVIFNITVPVTRGYTVMLHLHSLVDSVIITKLNAKVHKVTGDLIAKKPRCLLKNSAAIITVKTSKPICVELYENMREFGRFMLRDAGKTVAGGLITKIF